MTPMPVLTCGQRGSVACRGVRGYILLFYRASRYIHEKRTNAMEEPRCVQIFQEWLCLHSQDLGQQLLMLRRTGASETQPSQKSPERASRA